MLRKMQKTSIVNIQKNDLPNLNKYKQQFEGIGSDSNLMLKKDKEFSLLSFTGLEGC